MSDLALACDTKYDRQMPSTQKDEIEKTKEDKSGDARPLHQATSTNLLVARLSLSSEDVQIATETNPIEFSKHLTRVAIWVFTKSSKQQT